MSHIDPGPLATYESLADPHLTGYFNNSRMRKHLRRMGLITSRGEIVSEKVFRLNNARKEHQRHIRDVLAQAIVHKALDMERHRQMHIKRQLEEIGKIERVRRVRAERALRGDEDILPLLSPKEKQTKKGKSDKKEKVPILQTVADSEDYEQRPPQSVGYPALPSGPPYNTRAERMTMQYPNVEVDNQHLYELDRDALRSFTLNLSQFDLGSGVSPYSVPPPPKPTSSRKKHRKRPATATGVPHRPRLQRPRSNARSLRLHRREPPMMHRAQLHSLARVTFKYLGKMVHLDHEEEDPRDEIAVMQQHCGGENLRIFRGMLMKGDKFVIISRRHRTFPFSLTFYLNGVQVERLSTCCEYKHKTGHKLGAKSSHFGIVKIEGSQPCFKCLIAQGKLKTRPDPTPPPTGGRTKPSQHGRKPGKKLKGVDGKNQDEYSNDFQTSSKSSTTSEVEPDGPRVPSEPSSSEVSSDSSPLSSEDDSSSDEESSDAESELPSLKAYDDDDASSSSSDESRDPQKREDKPSKNKRPEAAKQERNKSSHLNRERSKTPSAGKERKKSPTKERAKNPGKERKYTEEKAERTPKPVKMEERSPPPSESSSKDLKEKKSSSVASESMSSLSSSDSGETVEEAPKAEEKSSPLLEVAPDKKTDSSSSAREDDSAKPDEVPERPRTPEPESASESSSSSSESEVESVKSNSSAEKKSFKKDTGAEKEKKYDSILPFLKGKANVDLNGMQLTEAQARELTKYFSDDPGILTIQQLSLDGCGIGSEKAKWLLNCLLKSKALKSLNISGNDLGDDCIEVILDVCQRSPVEHLSLANNPLMDGGCEDLFTGFSRSQATVVTVKLQKKVSQSLIASVLQDARLEMSDELGSSLSIASSVSSLASTTMSETVFLQSIDISNTRAGHAAFTSLGLYLALNPKLSHLNISGNAISTTALEAILKSLSDGTNKNLKVLHMNQATLDDRHAELIAKNLMENSHLTELSVKGNRITEKGIKMLEDYKKSNKSLDKLSTD